MLVYLSLNSEVILFTIMCIHMSFVTRHVQPGKTKGFALWPSGSFLSLLAPPVTSQPSDMRSNIVSVQVSQSQGEQLDATLDLHPWKLNQVTRLRAKG